DIFSDEEWSYEMKWDGYRALAVVQDKKTRLLSRNGHDLAEDFPELQELGSLLDERAILDGEIVALDSSGRPDFSLLQQRVSHQRKKRTKLASAIRIQYMVFDVLQLSYAENGLVDLTAVPYGQRRQRLEGLELDGRYVQVPPAHTGTLEEAIATSSELGLEGIVAKKRSSAYELGGRSGSWIKIKHQRHQEVVVIGWRAGQGSRTRTLASLLLAVPGEDGLEYAGRVGTGFSDAQLASIRERLGKIERQTPPAKNVPAAHQRDAHWVDPEYVAQVRYSELTGERLLRHPVWRGWRDDKQPDQVRWEAEDLAEGPDSK
ncbi:non-homologous end-joining DNA ligase, partial [Glutamicibacter arilaitensis]